VTGTVVTFYSFKGGVGRSFTLANVAILLARWGHRVLTIDWDLEAPGLHEYFSPLLPHPPRTGIVDLVGDFRTGAVHASSHYVTHLNTTVGTVDLIGAGLKDDGYPRRVQGINWAKLYEEGFADVLERLRNDWVRDYDFVLIDSRTGWADVASICTAHLPDRLVLVFTANEQSIGGAVEAVGKANQARDALPYDRPKLTVLPLLSRFDSRVEYRRAESWYETVTTMTTPLFSNWLVRHVAPALMLRHLTLPYVSYWSFGEQLPVLEETVPATDQISYGLETIAAIVAHRFDRTDLLADNRDAYVASAQGQARTFELDVLVSSPRSAEQLAGELVTELERLGIRAKRSLSGDIEFLGTSKDIARHLCLVVDEKVSRWQTTEAEWFLRRTLVAEDRRLFPVLTTASSPSALPGFLRNIRRLEMSTALTPRDVASRLRAEIADGALSDAEDAATLLDRTRSAVETTRDSPHDYADWFRVEQIFTAMAIAVTQSDLSSLVQLVFELQQLTTKSGSGYPAPEKVRDLALDVVRGIERQLRKPPRPAL
jgi:CobQ/CobB/MinD/ParA family nucleotide binding protein